MGIPALPFEGVHTAHDVPVQFPALTALISQVHARFPENEMARRVMVQALRFIEAGSSQQQQTLNFVNGQSTYKVDGRNFPRERADPESVVPAFAHRNGAEWAQTSALPYAILYTAFEAAGLRSHMPVDIDPRTGLAQQTLLETGVSGPGPFGLVSAPNFSNEFLIPIACTDEDGAPLLGLRAIAPYTTGWPPELVRVQLPGGMEKYELSKDSITFNRQGMAEEFFEEMISGSMTFTTAQEYEIASRISARLQESSPGENAAKLSRAVRAEYAVETMHRADPAFFPRLQAVLDGGRTISEGVYVHPQMTQNAWGESQIRSVDASAVENVMAQSKVAGLTWSAGDDAGAIIDTPLRPELLDGWNTATFAWSAAFALLNDFITHGGVLPASIAAQVGTLDSALVQKGLLRALPGTNTNADARAALA